VRHTEDVLDRDMNVVGVVAALFILLPYAAALAGPDDVVAMVTFPTPIPRLVASAVVRHNRREDKEASSG